MATYQPDYTLAIAIDPGYDATKVVINGLMFTIPCNVCDVTEFIDRKAMVGERKAGFLLSHYIQGKKYLVGEEARKLMLEKQMRDLQVVKESMSNSFERFSMMETEINMMTAIGMALVLYSEHTKKRKQQPILDILPGDDEKTRKHNETELGRFNLVIGVALPNDAVEDVWPTVDKKLTGTHEFAFETADNYYHLKFNIPEKEHTMALSQAVCALLGAASDDEGYEDENSKVLEKLPVLIIDGGYKTVGLFKLTTIKMVDEAESNADLAMGTVHKRVADRLKTEYGRNNIHQFSIPAILEDPHTHGEITYLKDGSTAVVDIRTLLEEESEKVCDELIEYINKKYENLLDIKQILITGGTGAAYYNRFMEYIKEHKAHLVNNVILTNYTFLGKPIDPVYAIAVGMYKTLLNQIHVVE